MNRFIYFILPILAMVALGSYAIIKMGQQFSIIPSGLATSIMIGVFVLMPIVLLLTMAIGFKHHHPILTYLFTPSALWLGILLYLLVGALLIVVGNFFFVALGVPIFTQILGKSILGIIVFAVSYGVYNASRPRVTTFTIHSSTLAPFWENKKIVLFSDIHLGIMRQEKFMRKVVSLVNQQSPDIVFVAGDIIDGPIFPYEKSLTYLKEIKAPFGIFYTPGNHEGYNSEPEKFFPLVRSLTTTLIDQKTEVNSTQIIGLDYRIESDTETENRLEKTGYNPNMPSIVILHDPKNAEALIRKNVSLILSGHTHGGQFFPINLIVKSIYKNRAHGVTQEKNGSVTITTCGVGTAMTPMRLGTNPEIVVIQIEK